MSNDGALDTNRAELGSVSRETVGLDLRVRDSSLRSNDRSFLSRRRGSPSDTSVSRETSRLLPMGTDVKEALSASQPEWGNSRLRRSVNVLAYFKDDAVADIALGEVHAYGQNPGSSGQINAYLDL